jgi:hypothetical protein
LGVSVSRLGEQLDGRQNSTLEMSAYKAFWCDSRHLSSIELPFFYLDIEEQTPFSKEKAG